MANNLKSPGFKSLLATLFLGAYNDNAFKFVIAMLVVDQYVGQTGGMKYLALTGALFVAPFLLFSTFSGHLADKFSKQRVIYWTKVAELIIMTLGLFALWTGNIWFIFSVLFLMGAQSTFFSPSKYGILPEILEEKELSEGNGLIQMVTYIAIILGQATSGFLIHFTKPDIYKTAFFFIVISAVGIWTSLFITKVKASGSERTIQWNFLGEIFHNIKWLKDDKPIFLSIMGLMYFGFLSALFHLNIVAYARNLMGADHIATSILTAIIAIGIGAGAVSAGKLSDKKIEFGIVPIGAIGLTILSFVLGNIVDSYTSVAVCLFLIGAASGFFVVPLSSYIQYKSPHDRKGQVLATNNFLSFFAMMVASGALYVLGDVVNLDAAQIFIVASLITLVGTSVVCSLLPYALVRFLVWVLTHTLYKIKIINRESIPEKGGALLVSNHMSYVDALLILVSTDRPIRFLIHRDIYNIKILNPIFRLAQVIPISGTDNPKEVIRSLNTAKDALEQGDLVCIFAEGMLSRTGNMLKFNKGLEVIMKRSSAPIIPIHLDRVWGSIFSFERGKFFFKAPKIFPYPVTVSLGTPMPANSTAFQISNRVRELGAEAFQHRLTNKHTLSEVFWQEARKRPQSFCIADSSGKNLNYASTLIASVSLANKLNQKLATQQNVGVLLPPSVAGTLTNIALDMIGKTPVNLNYTTSQESLNSIVNQCEMMNVITSKVFVEKTGITVSCPVLYIEDIIGSITKSEQMKAVLKAYVFPSVLSHRLVFGKRKRSMDDLATIMFTSGSTGEPKGVMLTHANITSNLEGLYQIFHIRRDDVVLGILPFFHSFGFTATLWFPLLSGIGSVYHVNPLDARMIGKLAQKYQATILMGTPTFLNSYTKRCTEEQFKSLRVVVVGAEKLKENVAKTFKEKFNIDPMEGYGCTELSPIVAINLPDYHAESMEQKAFKPGKIGLPLPGIAIKILDQTTMQPVGLEENGLMFVKGPNVMKGYLNRQEATAKVIKDGWYETGDIANMDEDGFITITDRLSRFSKIAGEMVPHIKVEEKIHSILDVSEQVCVVTSIPDEKKGEKLAVLYKGEINVDDLVSSLKKSDLPKLWIPDTSMFQRIEEIPLLGTGKMDLGSIKRMTHEKFNQ